MTDTWTDRWDAAYPPPAAPPPAVASPAAPAPNPGLDRAISGLEGSMQRQSALAADQQSALAPRYAAASRAIDAPIPQAPRPQPVAAAPKPEDYQKYSLAFAGAMAMLGAVASGATRLKGHNALAAFNGAMTGWQAGNLQAYEQSTKQWEQNTKATIENNAAELAQYKAVLENRRLNIDQQMSQIQIIAAQHQDKMMFEAATAKNFTLVAQLHGMRERVAAQVTRAQGPLTNAQRINEQRMESQASYWDSPAGVARMAVPEGQPGALTAEQRAGVERLREQRTGNPESIENTAKLIAEGRIAPLSGYALRSPFGQQVMSRVQEINPEYRAAEYHGGVAAERTRAAAEPRADSAALTRMTQSRSAITAFEQTARRNGEVLVQLAEKTDATGVPVIERWVRAGRMATGDPDVARLHAQMNVYRAEVARILTNPNLVGVLTDSARRETEGFLSNASSARQVRGVVELLNGDFDRRRDTLDEEIASLRGRLQPGRGAPAGSAAPAGAPVRVQTPADAQRLKPGTRYTTPDGQEMVR